MAVSIRHTCFDSTLNTNLALPALVRCITPPPSASLSSTSGIALPSVAITQHSRTKPMTRIRSLDGDKSSFAALSADRCHANDTDTSDLSPTQTQPSICEAKSSQAPTSAGATYTDSLDRVLSDIYQDELYNPSVTSSSPPQPPRQYITKERSSSTQRNSAVHDLLQAAQSGHVAARQPSPTHLPQEQSCFRPGSQEQISISKDPIFGLILGPSGAQKDNVEASDLSEARHRTFLLKNDYSLIDQGLPDKDRPMLIAEEYLDSILPQLQEYKASRWANVEPPQGFDKARYYKNPIVVNLFSLPPSLRERPIDAFYFHFFIDYTAIVLLPYPCSEILPKSLCLH